MGPLKSQQAELEKSRKSAQLSAVFSEGHDLPRKFWVFHLGLGA